MVRLLSVLKLCAIAGLIFAQPLLAQKAIDPNNPAQGLFQDEWMEVYLAGGKIGYGHSTMIRQGDEIHTSVKMNLKIARAKVSLKLGVTQTTVETLQGEPLEFGSVTKMADQPMQMAGKIKDGKVIITSSQFGMKKTSTYDYTAGALMAWGLTRESLLKGFEPGTTYTLSTYSPDVRMDGPVKATTTVGDEESFTHRGQTYHGHKVSTILSAPMGDLKTTSWVDATGKMLKTRIFMAGLTMDMYAVDEETAVSDFVPAELFMNNTLPVDRYINKDRAERITYQLTLKDDAKGPLSLPETPAQKVLTAIDGKSAVVTVTRSNHDAIRKMPPSNGSDDISQYLESNILINKEDPDLAKLAKQAAEGEKDPLRLADKLRQFVTRYISDKNLGVGFATASDVCRSRQGDCSEHAVLLAALGRIDGLPSRVATGIAYVPSFGGKRNLFGFHMWTQFLINGQWVDFDAALRESQCSPIRIAFDVNSLHETALAEMSFKLMKVLGRLDLKVLKIDKRPTVSSPPKSAATP